VSALEVMEMRLELLEKSNRNLKRGCVLIFICLAAFVTMSAQRATKRTIEANEFVLRGRDGQVQATLYTDDAGDARLVFLKHSNHSLRSKGILAADRLVFSDYAGNARIELRPSPDGGTLTLGDQHAVGLEVSSDANQAGIYIATGGTKDILSLSIKKNGELLQNGPAIQLSDESGFSMSLGQAVVPGKPTTSVASLRMYGKDGKVIWSAP
jgi:hypothetical protein